MTTERINVFDEMYKERDYTWSDMVKKGKIITISGTVATDENHRTLYKGDLMGQTRYIYETVEKLLAKVGATFDDVIKTTDYITPQAVKDMGRQRKYGVNFLRAIIPLRRESLSIAFWLPIG